LLTLVILLDEYCHVNTTLAQGMTYHGYSGSGYYSC